jgi:hypothetical protein
MDAMDTFVVLIVAVTVIILVSLAGRAVGKKARSPYSGSPDAKRSAAGAAASSGATAPLADGALVAVLAAAVAAASGMSPGSFRVVGIEPSAPASYGSRGLNTPVWGHVERFNRGEHA